eukprot:scaffold24508_cov66-Phaeocystis_antarctica.AAC.2
MTKLPRRGPAVPLHQRRSPGANQRVASRRPTTAPPVARGAVLALWVGGRLVAPAGLGLGSLPALSCVGHC